LSWNSKRPRELGRLKQQGEGLWKTRVFGRGAGKTTVQELLENRGAKTVIVPLLEEIVGARGVVERKNVSSQRGDGFLETLL